jgi:hypothetical protein
VSSPLKLLAFLPDLMTFPSCRTFNVYYFISIIVGEAVGEILFGRFCLGGGHH